MVLHFIIATMLPCHCCPGPRGSSVCRKAVWRRLISKVWPRVVRSSTRRCSGFNIWLYLSSPHFPLIGLVVLCILVNSMERFHDNIASFSLKGTTFSALMSQFGTDWGLEYLIWRCRSQIVYFDFFKHRPPHTHIHNCLCSHMSVQKDQFLMWSGLLTARIKEFKERDWWRGTWKHGLKPRARCSGPGRRGPVERQTPMTWSMLFTLIARPRNMLILSSRVYDGGR